MPDRIALRGRCDPWDLALRLADEPQCVAFIGDWCSGRALLADRPSASAVSPAAVDADRSGAWAGWWGYGGTCELRRYDHVVVGDTDGRWWVECTVADSDVDIAVADRWQQRLDLVAGAPPAFEVGEVTANTSRSRHIGIVEETILAIAAGDFFQANICLRLQATFTGSALALWCRAGRRLRPPRAAFVGRPGGGVASLSPEVFVTRAGEVATTRPIKGTRPLTAAGLAELRAADKDAAEHVMIVDLARNDLASVSVPGSVEVPQLREAKALAGVWHLESAVTARTRVPDGALVDALFPPGSVTGAPKSAAVSWCAGVEESERVAYCGAVGFSSSVHGLQTSVAIRTAEIADDRLWLGVGGGIVADSVPEAEWAECQAKASPVLAAIGAPPWRENGVLPEVDGPVFETILVVDGVPLSLVQHADRMCRSRSVDRNRFLETVRRCAAELGPGCFRLRIENDLCVRTAPIPEPAILRGSLDSLALRSYAVPARNGAHKRSDRRFLEEAEAACSPAEPLLLDDTEVLETTRANVFALSGGRWLTPALDGRILPGVMRRTVLDAIVDGRDPLRIGPLSYADLLTADAVIVTNALRGLWWVREVDGAARWDEPAPAVWNVAARVRRRMLARISAR